MINFGDTKGLQDIEVNEPIAKAQAIGFAALQKGIEYIDRSAKEESAAMKEIADEMYKSGKVDFMGKDITEFKNKYQELRC
jgi:hypothetical protein